MMVQLPPVVNIGPYGTILAQTDYLISLIAIAAYKNK